MGNEGKVFRKFCGEVAPITFSCELGNINGEVQLVIFISAGDTAIQ